MGGWFEAIVICSVHSLTLKSDQASVKWPTSTRILFMEGFKVGLKEGDIYRLQKS